MPSCDHVVEVRIEGRAETFLIPRIGGGAYANGRLPQSALRPIAGGGYLAPGPAAGWNAMAAHIYRETGTRIAVTGPDSAYRSYDRQVYYWNLYQSGRGNLAARPGASNHGWGINVDVPMYVRQLIDKYGAQFGWSKSWSDAPSEWWHITYQAGHYKGRDPGPGGTFVKDKYPTLKRGKKGGAVKRAQKHLRRWNLGVVRPDVDGDFGETTADAVRQFQIIHNLKPDAIIGKTTWRALRRKDFLTPSERVRANKLKLIQARKKPTPADEEKAGRLKEWCARRALWLKEQGDKHGKKWWTADKRRRQDAMQRLAGGKLEDVRQQIKDKKKENKKR